MIEDVEQALRLQEIDKRISTLNSEIIALPKHIAEIEKQLDSHNRKLAGDQAILAANQKDRKQRDLDIATHQQKISKLRDQMQQAKNNEQYKAFQNEIDFCEAEIRKAEDRIIELMSESETLIVNVKAAETSLAEERKQVESEKAEARQRTEADQKLLNEETEKRSAIFTTFTPQIQAIITRLKKKHVNGVFVSDATRGACSGCKMQLRPQHFQNLKISTTIVFCESCGRILRYAPPTDQQAMYEGGTRVAMS